MNVPFFIVATITVAGAIGVLCLRQIIHSVLCSAIVFAGLAMMYLQLGAQFVGFAQFLIYIGAVTILILFAILLTKNSGPSLVGTPFASRWVSGILIVLLVLSCLIWSIETTQIDPIDPSDQIDQPDQSAQSDPMLLLDLVLPDKPLPSVKDIGEQLMKAYVIPLEVIALLLTAAMVGAIVIAMNEPKSKSKSKSSSQKDGNA